MPAARARECALSAASWHRTRWRSCLPNAMLPGSQLAARHAPKLITIKHAQGHAKHKAEEVGCNSRSCLVDAPGTALAEQSVAQQGRPKRLTWHQTFRSLLDFNLLMVPSLGLSPFLRLLSSIIQIPGLDGSETSAAMLPGQKCKNHNVF